MTVTDYFLCSKLLYFFLEFFMLWIYKGTPYRFSTLKTFMNLLEILFPFLPAFSHKCSRETVSMTFQVVWSHSTFSNKYFIGSLLWVRYCSGLKGYNSDHKCEKYLPSWNLYDHRKRIICLEIVKKTKNTNLTNRWLKGWLMIPNRKGILTKN